MNNSYHNILGSYLKKRGEFKPFIKDLPSSELGICIIIPCYNEPDIIQTLISIAECQKPQSRTEIIVVINSSENTEPNIINFNKETQKQIESWASKLKLDWLQIYTILIENIPKKKAGVGFARKTGMDESIYRFLQAKTENGIICSLDADSTVSKNYLFEIEKTFNKQNPCGCSLYFEHEIEGSRFSNEIYRRIIEYELHLRYYKLVLQKINFPYYHYTIGSCFAVSPTAYCLQGGMSSKQAGEDFYFLQKIMPLGNFLEINSITVSPSPRPSDRVPFGTGPTVHNHAINPLKEFTTYNFNSFAPLNELFEKKESFFKADEIKINTLIKDLPDCLRDFLERFRFKDGINIINSNTKQPENFIRKFFGWFDGFRIVKYLNFIHLHYFEKQNIIEACKELLNLKNSQFTPKELLIYLRNMEKNKEV